MCRISRWLRFGWMRSCRFRWIFNCFWVFEVHVSATAKNGKKARLRQWLTLAKLWRDAFDCVDYLYKDVANSTVDECVKAAAKISDFSYLLIQPPVINSSAIDFSKNVKSQAFIRDAIKGARCCSICGGYLHKNSISIDHMVRRADGGLGTVENAQLSHPFCNTGIKN